MRNKDINKELLKKKNTIANEMRCERNNYFGEALKELRLEKELTQNEAAKLLGITQAMWSAYEVGKSRPDLDTIISIARVLKVSPFVLINKSLDKSKYLDPVYELSFKDYEIIEDTVIKKFRKNKLEKRIKDCC